MAFTVFQSLAAFIKHRLGWFRWVVSAFLRCKRHKHFPFTSAGFANASSLAHLAKQKGHYANPQFCYFCGEGIIILTKQEVVKPYVHRSELERSNR